MAIAGIKYEKNIRGVNTHVRIDLKRYGNNELLEDFLDGMEAQQAKNEPTTPWEDVKKRLNKIHGIK